MMMEKLNRRQDLEDILEIRGNCSVNPVIAV